MLMETSKPHSFPNSDGTVMKPIPYGYFCKSKLLNFDFAC